MVAKLASYLTIATLSVYFIGATAIVCTPGICDHATCQNETTCGPYEKLKPSGFCNCCLKCVRMLQENESCWSLLHNVMGAPPPLQECAEGLICSKGICRRIDKLLKNMYFT